jgi:8-oxo-dGTP pyrophosphatase MutT (NUDIX family)
MNPQDVHIHCAVVVELIGRGIYAAPVRVDRPPPGEEWSDGELAEAREAATLILLRDAPDGAEVLLVQRNPEQRFMGGAWVFPGGGVHEDDDGPAAAAVRELEEEAGVSLPDATELVPFSRWITPEGVKIRFDTWFFAAEAPAGAEPEVDGSECVDARWMRPADALEARARDELMLVFPTIKHLELLARTTTVAETLAAARERPVTPVLPKVIPSGVLPRVLLPGEPGYDEA